MACNKPDFNHLKMIALLMVMGKGSIGSDTLDHDQSLYVMFD